MRQVLGKKIRKKRAITSDGKELGKVIDAYFEKTGRIDSILIEPESVPRKAEQYTNKDGRLIIPFQHVEAVGEYVIINFPLE
ncbi:MAG: PRC-barrel domain-containing protein [archaeon]